MATKRGFNGDWRLETRVCFKCVFYGDERVKEKATKRQRFFFLLMLFMRNCPLSVMFAITLVILLRIADWPKHMLFPKINKINLMKETSLTNLMNDSKYEGRNLLLLMFLFLMLYYFAIRN